MIEVFITDITKKCQTIEMVEVIEKMYSELKINFDMDVTNLPFPQGHTVLRIEGESIDEKIIISLVKKSGFNCQIMEDIILQ